MFFGTGFPKEFTEMMEKAFVEKMNEMIRNPEFLSSFSKVVGTGLEGKKKADDLSREYLQKMHLPSRDDVANVLQYLQQIESRLIGMEEKIEDLSDQLRSCCVEEPKSPRSPGSPKATAKKEKESSGKTTKKVPLRSTGTKAKARAKGRKVP